MNKIIKLLLEGVITWPKKKKRNFASNFSDFAVFQHDCRTFQTNHTKMLSFCRIIMSQVCREHFLERKIGAKSSSRVFRAHERNFSSPPWYVLLNNCSLPEFCPTPGAANAEVLMAAGGEKQGTRLEHAVCSQPCWDPQPFTLCQSKPWECFYLCPLDHLITAV